MFSSRRKQFGVFQGGSYVVPAYWQSLWNALPQLTTGLGAWLSGPVSDRYGRRLTMFMAGIFSVVGVAIIYTADASPQFLVGKMVNSLGLGAALAAGQTYVSEITPTKIRGIALAVYTVCLVRSYSLLRCLWFCGVVANSSYPCSRASDTSSPHRLPSRASPSWTNPPTRSSLLQSGPGRWCWCSSLSWSPNRPTSSFARTR